MALGVVRSPIARKTTKVAAANAPTLQAQKSAQTRARLTEATITCLVKYGYARTTTPQVAAEACLSRGAMLHHFENGEALIKATIIELHEKRLRAFRRAAGPTEHDTSVLVTAYWKQIQKPAFIAFHELALAARTNPDLAGILHPLQKEFRERFNAEAVHLFPEWQSDIRKFDMAMTLSQTLLEGMAISLLTGAIDTDRVEPMLRLMEQQIELMKPESIKPKLESVKSRLKSVGSKKL